MDSSGLLCLLGPQHVCLLDLLQVSIQPVDVFVEAGPQAMKDGICGSRICDARVEYV